MQETDIACGRGRRARMARSSASSLYTKSECAANTQRGIGSGGGAARHVREASRVLSCTWQAVAAPKRGVPAWAQGGETGSQGRAQPEDFWWIQGVSSVGLGLACRTVLNGKWHRGQGQWITPASNGEDEDVPVPSQSLARRDWSQQAIYTCRCFGTTSRLNTSSSVSRRRMSEALLPVTKTVAGRGTALKLLMETSW